MPRPQPKPARTRRFRPAPATLVAFAERLATRVGKGLLRALRSRTPIERMNKGEGDPVTQLDIDAERRLRDAIDRAWPQHGFLGEETGKHELDREYVWVVDPIDGTANFAAGLMPWGVSVACLRRGAPVAGAVFCMPASVTYVAGLGMGTRVGRTRVRIPTAGRLGADSIVGTQWFRGVEDVPFLRPLLATGARIRVHGSTVTQMCHVAAGRLAANIQTQGRVWDIAAASLVVAEAGGCVTDWHGAPVFPVRDLADGSHYPTIAAEAGILRSLVRRLRGVRIVSQP